MAKDPENGKAKPAPLWCSSRLPFFILCSFATLNFIMQRANINFALVCMVKPPILALNASTSDSDAFNLTISSAEPDFILNTNESFFDVSWEDESTELPLEGVGEEDLSRCKADISHNRGAGFEGEFEWDKGVQANILGSFFYGFILTQILGGWISDKFGGKKAFIGSVASISTLTILNPIAAMQGPEYLFVVRLIAGLSQGASLPLLNVLGARWAGNTERAFLMGIAFGGFSVAVFVTNPLCAFICKNGGWTWIFYVTGGIGLVWCLVAFFVIYDWPEDHPRISQSELEYLQKNRAVQKGGDGPKRKFKTPWRKIFLSGPINVTHFAHFCALWSFNTVGMYLPVFMKEVLRMDLSKNGLYSALPFLGMLLLHLFSGSIFDACRRRKFCSLTNLRKIFNTLGFVLPGISVAFMGFISCTNNLPEIVAISIGHSFVEFAMMGGYFFSIFELAPRFSGLVTGITNTYGVLTGFICPAVVGALTKNGTREEWKIVFYIASGFTLLGALVYLLFGSSELQPWAAPLPQRKETELKDLKENLLVPNGDKKPNENEAKILLPD